MKLLARKSLRVALAVSLALATGSAAALGLGQIELKSRLGQPLLAEIPIISGDPSELEALTAGLPSPETFARIGLQLPDEFVSSLKFTSALDANGRPVIRVTSEAPVTDPLLTFLVEVDSGQGRVVREYSLLVDAPRTVSAPVQPTIDSATVGPSNTIVREPQVASTEPATEATPEAQAAADATAATEATPDAIAATEPTPAPAPVAAAPAPEPIAAMPTPPAATGEYAVRAGDTLSQIAGGMNLAPSLDQAMIALLRANPDAFINGNINLLKQGAVLRTPAYGDVVALEAAEATALVRSQAQEWRESRRPLTQPEAVGERGDVASAATTRSAARASSGPRTADARLEIVPPGASAAKRAGTQSGISAGGEGEMLRQELLQTKENLAARDAELAEMKARVEELEKLQSQQQQLMTMKDSELAAAQKRLADSNQKAAQASPATQDGGNAMTPWLLGGAGLVLLALVGWWFGRRRGSAAAKAFHDTVSKPAKQSIADAFPTASAAPRLEPVLNPPKSAPAAQPARVAPAAAPAKSVPAWHTGGASAAGSAPTATAKAAPGPEQLDLARAYIDLGDQESARNLLTEIAIGGDASARQRAAQMLRELE